MSGAPAEVLLSRALHFLEGAQLQLTAGNIDKAAEDIEKGAALVQEVLSK